LLWRMLCRHRCVGRIASGRCFATLFLLSGWMFFHLCLETFGNLVVVVSFSRFRCLVVAKFGGFEFVSSHVILIFLVLGRLPLACGAL
jgi:hypothetical protein